MKRYMLSAMLLFASFSVAETPNLEQMFRSSNVIQGALSAITGSLTSREMYIPEYGLVLVFNQLGSPDDFEASLEQFLQLINTLANTVQGVPEGEWLTFYWSFGFMSTTEVIARLKPDDPEVFEVWQDGRLLE